MEPDGGVHSSHIRAQFENQEWHERGHSSLEVAMSGLVINPEYSWRGASLDGT